MSESKLVRQIIEYIERDGFAIKINSNALTSRGIPDIIGSYRGKPIALEIKLNSQSSKLQEYWIQKFRDGGYIAGVIHSVEELEALYE